MLLEIEELIILVSENPEEAKKIPSIIQTIKTSKGVISCTSPIDGEIAIILEDSEDTRKDHHLLGLDWRFNGKLEGLTGYVKRIKDIRVSVRYKNTST